MEEMYLCACPRVGFDGTTGGCNSLVDQPESWCPTCFESSDCRAELGVPRVAWITRWLVYWADRLDRWVRGYNARRHLHDVERAEQVGMRRWHRFDGVSQTHVELPEPEFIAHDADGPVVVCDSSGAPLLVINA